MTDLKLYIVDDKYIAYLQKTVSGHIFANNDPFYRHARKYLGIIIEIGVYKYYVPLSSPKNSDYTLDEEGKKTVRKSIIPIIRMTESNQAGEKSLLGTLKFSNMIPVPDDQIYLYDLNNESDQKYKTLVEKEVRFINRHTAQILKHAAVIYKQKKDGKEIHYLESTLDFSALEKAYDAYCRQR